MYLVHINTAPSRGSSTRDALQLTADRTELLHPDAYPGQAVTELSVSQSRFIPSNPLYPPGHGSIHSRLCLRGSIDLRADTRPIQSAGRTLAGGPRAATGLVRPPWSLGRHSCLGPTYDFTKPVVIVMAAGTDVSLVPANTMHVAGVSRGSYLGMYLWVRPRNVCLAGNRCIN